MLNPYNRNNDSLFAIPEFLYNPNWLGLDEYNLWSWHTWVRDNRFLPAYHISIKYSFEPDQRGLFRAQVRNIWHRSERLEVYCQGERLNGQELINAKLEIRERLKRALDRNSLKGYPVRRYIFNIIASVPNVCLKGFHSHHENMFNTEMNNLAESNGMVISDAWLKATDDRFKEVSSFLPKSHILEHIYSGDVDAFDYNKCENNVSLFNEIVEVKAEIEDVNVVLGKCTNSANHSVVAFPKYDLMAIALKLLREWQSDYIEQRIDTNCVMLT